MSSYQPTLPQQPQMPSPVDTKSKVYLEAVIVCVNYADFLAYTLPTNRQVFDKIIVVTSKADKHTQQVCAFYEVECLVTDVFYENGAPFNKGKGINAGLDKLSKRGWVVHLDADMYLPPLTRLILQTRFLDKSVIYGIDRLMCHGFDNWVKFLHKPILMHELYYLVQARAFEMGTRVAHYNQLDGWFPIGFFQMWHPAKSGVMRYPENSVGADHTDVVFAKMFPVGKRQLIPEFYGIHLDSERAKMGANWMGRKTVPFTITAA